MFINDSIRIRLQTQNKNVCVAFKRCGMQLTAIEQLCAWGGVAIMCAASVLLIGLLASQIAHSLARCALLEVVRGLGGL